MKELIVILLLCFPIVCKGQTIVGFGDEFPSSDSTSLAEFVLLAENNSVDSSDNVRSVSYAGGYDAVFYHQGSYSFEFETSDLLTVTSFTRSSTTQTFVYSEYHESSESDNGGAKISGCGNTTDGWTIEHDQVNGDIEVHNYVSGVDREARTANGVLQEDEWQRIVIIFNTSDVEIWLNGVDVTSTVASGITTWLNSSDIIMGDGVNSSVDAVHNYNFAVSSAQVTALKDPNYVLKELN